MNTGVLIGWLLLAGIFTGMDTDDRNVWLLLVEICTGVGQPWRGAPLSLSFDRFDTFPSYWAIFVS